MHKSEVLFRIPGKCCSKKGNDLLVGLTVQKLLVYYSAISLVARSHVPFHHHLQLLCQPAGLARQSAIGLQLPPADNWSGKCSVVWAHIVTVPLDLPPLLSPPLSYSEHSNFFHISTSLPPPYPSSSLLAHPLLTPFCFSPPSSSPLPSPSLLPSRCLTS